MNTIKGKSAERYLNLLDMQSEFQKLFDYKEPNDRAIVIVGGAFLDTLLENILLEFFPEDEKEVESLLGPSGNLGTYGSRIKILFCLGFLEKVISSDLKLIGKIRNKFAHDISISFETTQIESWVRALKWHKIYFMNNESPEGATLRDIFQVEVNTLISHLNGVIGMARNERRTIKNNF